MDEKRAVKKSLVLVIAASIMLSCTFGFAGGFAAANLFGDNQKTAETYREIASDISDEAERTVAAAPDITIENLKNAAKTELSTSEITKLVADAVVEITTEVVTTDSRLGQYISGGAGSGVIVSYDGYIITNNHVIDDAQKITVKLRNGKEYNAKLIGTDAQMDVAVIKIESGDAQLTITKIGDSDALEVGEPAVAIGNPLGSLGGTVTDGIISALQREIQIDGETMTLLQTNAAINPGNSGGGLFNCYGELIGIVNAKSSGTGIEGLGFAIPINDVVDVAKDLIEYGYVRGRASMGVTFVEITDLRTAMYYRVNQLGVYVYSAEGSETFMSGDLVLSIDDTTISTLDDITTLMSKHSVGDTVTVKLSRGGTAYTLAVVLQEAHS